MPAPKDIIPPRNRGYVIDNKNSGARIEITEDIINWNDLAFKHERDGFSGVFLSVSQPLEVCRRAKIIIREAFRQPMMSMNMMFEIMRRGPKDFIYERIHSMRLNPGTYEERKDYISIEGQSLTFDALVKSVGKTKYDFLVADVIDENWQYNHNEVFVVGNWEVPNAAWAYYGAGNDGIVVSGGATSLNGTDYTITATLNKAEMVVGGIENDFRGQAFQKDNTGTKEFFFKSDADQTVRLDMEFQYYLTFSQMNFSSANSTIWLQRYNDLGDTATSENILSATVFSSRDPDTGQTFGDSRVFSFHDNLTLKKGDKLRLVVEASLSLSGTLVAPYGFAVGPGQFKELKISYIDQSSRTDTIPVITPHTLANRLLYDMSGGDPLKRYTAEIDTDTDNPWTFDHYLVAAESIRGFEKANFHASFNDFIEYMKFLGYEYETDEDARIVHFRKRAYFFNPGITAMRLSEGEVANVVIKGNDEYAYSTVRVGYEKPDIENTNGRFAICGAFDYATDYSNSGDLKDSTLEIMCPYKADPVLIETLSWTRGEKTTDQKDDNDIFMLAGVTVGDHVEESRTGQYVVEDDDLDDSIEWFNAPYIPYFIVKRNAGMIGVAVRNLTFTATDAYREATLSGAVTVDPYSDIAIADGLFLPMTYEFDAGTQQGLPPAILRAGLVKFMWNGRWYQGYIKELVEHAVHKQGESWVLLAR